MVFNNYYTKFAGDWRLQMSAKRKWWQKKTNWAIAVGIINNLVPITAIVPYIGLPVTAVVNVLAAAFGVYSVADRAGKPPEA
jgi:hypothetical protein